MVESIIDTILPIIISILEMMGILIITIGSFRAFYHYVRALSQKMPTLLNINLLIPWQQG